MKLNTTSGCNIKIFVGIFRQKLYFTKLTRYKIKNT